MSDRKPSGKCAECGKAIPATPHTCALSEYDGKPFIDSMLDDELTGIFERLHAVFCNECFRAVSAHRAIHGDKRFYSSLSTVEEMLEEDEPADQP